jgi:hypothetical protein
LNILIKYIVGCKIDKDKSYRGYDSMREGDKGDTPFINYLFTHLYVRGMNEGVCESLRETTLCLGHPGYLNLCMGLFGGSFISGLIIIWLNHWVPLSFFLICVMGMAWKRMVGGREPFLDGCKELLIIP